MRIEEFQREVDVVLDEMPGIRYGQACYNLLYDLDAELAVEINNTDADPFHAPSPSDKRISEFFSLLMLSGFFE